MLTTRSRLAAYEINMRHLGWWLSSSHLFECASLWLSLSHHTGCLVCSRAKCPI